LKRSRLCRCQYSFRHHRWSEVDRTEHQGDTGLAYWRTRTFGNIRVRMVEYTLGYFANHGCVKGHVLLCLEGELHTELEDGRKFTLGPGELPGRGQRRSAPLVHRGRRQAVHRRLKWMAPSGRRKSLT
jgi:hypothetical protein